MEHAPRLHLHRRHHPGRCTACLTYEGPLCDVFNLGESQTTTLNELISRSKRALGKKAIINKLPEQPGDVPLTYADIAKARGQLGYNRTRKSPKGSEIRRVVSRHIGLSRVLFCRCLMAADPSPFPPLNVADWLSHHPVIGISLAGFCLWVSVSLIVRMWLVHRRVSFLKKFLWSFMLLIPLFGCSPTRPISYSRLYRCGMPYRKFSICRLHRQRPILTALSSRPWRGIVALLIEAGAMGRPRFLKRSPAAVVCAILFA
jgi:hypothetical protein